MPEDGKRRVAHHFAVGERVTRTAFVEQQWALALPTLMGYIAVPARSPMFDPDWERTGHIARAAELLTAWVRARDLPGMTVELHCLPGLTPVLFVEVAATRPELAGSTVVLYGHMDKQPEMEPWADGLAPWKPVLDGDRLYGRGGADDGYSVFAALLALQAIHDEGHDHARCVVLIEASEESSSAHLAAHLERLLPRIGEADLVVTLDSFCETYDRLWTTTSTRGVAGGVIEIDVCSSDPHSGRASGVLPSAFRVLRVLIARLEAHASGRVLVESANVPIPAMRVAEAAVAARAFAPLASSFGPVPTVEPVAEDAAGQLLAETWRPALEVIGMDGIPSVADGGNVFRSRLRTKISLRIPPTSDVDAVSEEIADLLTTDPPFGTAVRFISGAKGPGWEAPQFAPWLAAAADQASRAHFGQSSAACGVGGTIPFMGMLGELLPAAQFLLVGVLGPESNAHGPNEFLHLPTARRVTACVADVISAHARHVLDGVTADGT